MIFVCATTQHKREGVVELLPEGGPDKLKVISLYGVGGGHWSSMRGESCCTQIITA